MDKDESKQVIGKNKLSEIEASVKELLGLMSLKDYELSVVLNKDNYVEVNINSSNEALLIGHKGSGLNSLQLVLRMIMYKKFGFWIPLLLNVGDYLEQRKASLERLAQNLSHKVKFSKEPQEINNLSSAERRVVHLYLKEHPDVETESIDGVYGRKLLIKAKK